MNQEGFNPPTPEQRDQERRDDAPDPPPQTLPPKINKDVYIYIIYIYLKQTNKQTELSGCWRWSERVSGRPGAGGGHTERIVPGVVPRHGLGGVPGKGTAP